MLRLGSDSCRLQNLVITFTGDGDKDARHATAAQPGGKTTQPGRGKPVKPLVIAMSLP